MPGGTLARIVTSCPATRTEPDREVPEALLVIENRAVPEPAPEPVVTEMNDDWDDAVQEQPAAVVTVTSNVPAAPPIGAPGPVTV